MHDTPYALGFYRATASFRKAKSSLGAAVESSVSQASPGVRDRIGGIDQSPKRKRGVSPMRAQRRATRSLALGALIGFCAHVGAPS